MAGSSERLPAVEHQHQPGAGDTSGVFLATAGTCVVDEARRACSSRRSGHRVAGPAGARSPWAISATATRPSAPSRPSRASAPVPNWARSWPTARSRLLGRDSVTINTGGQKVFAEEVESALADTPGVGDVVVVGRPSERWGTEVVAVVQIRRARPNDENCWPGREIARLSSQGHRPRRHGRPEPCRQDRLPLGHGTGAERSSEEEMAT
ncbi:hypothetical protein HBB16_11815 [Pseudonocardia sp. MCCB 268]|nr:hypothetical protein [Pseudonocardia cytotoxica]